MGVVHTATAAPHRARRRVASAAILAAAVCAVSASPAHADDHGRGGVEVSQRNLVADNATFGADVVDPALVNAWGMSKLAASPVWVSDNGTDTSTLYSGPTATAGVAKVGLTVTMDGPPTGQVANTTTGFALTNGLPARFIFALEDGRISAWNQQAGTIAEQKAAVAGGVFKGLTQANVGADAFLYAADFANGTIDVFDSSWKQVDWHGAFRVRHLPRGFAPFNVQALTDPHGVQHVFVAYAKRNQATNDEIAGRGLGLVAEFTTSGRLLQTFDGHDMNAPWGLAFAPESWGRAAGDLLVGQFGNGRIEMYDTRRGDHVGTVDDATGRALVIDGLWALMAGDSTAGGVGTMLFTAGPNDEADGLYGVLSVLPAVQHDDGGHGD